MKWRIYRLPGSREIWHIDGGRRTKCGQWISETQIINVQQWNCNVDSRSVDIGGNNTPRAWIEIDSPCYLHIINGVAIFDFPTVGEIIEDAVKCAAVSKE